MKVLHITNNYPTKKFPIFGIFVKEQIASLEAIGLNNEVFFINGRENGRLEYFKRVFTLRKTLRSNNYDIIHCHHALSLFCLILTGLSKKFKVITSFQNDPVNELGRYIYYFLNKFSNGFIFKNNSSFKKGKYAFYLPNGVNINFFKPIDKKIAREKLNLNLNDIYVLFVSSNYIRKQKRYDKFRKTLHILKTDYNYINIKEIKMTNIKRNKIPYYFNAVDLHLLTSDFEGSPNSVKESLACDTPVVSTNVGNVHHLLDGMSFSFYSKKNTAKDLAKLAHKSLKKNFNEGPQQIKKLKLDSKSVALRLKDIYKDIIKSKYY